MSDKIELIIRADERKNAWMKYVNFQSSMLKNGLKYLLLFLLSANVLADTDWTRVAMNTVVVMDWAQTRDAMAMGYIEENNILGEHPSDDEVNKYFLTLLISYNLIGEYLISEKYKAVFYGGIFITHGIGVENNYGFGVKFKID